MSRATSNSTLLKRAANVTIVALCMVCSLVLLGAVPAEFAANREAATTIATAPAQATIPAERHVVAEADESLAVPAAAMIPADLDLLTDIPAVPVTPPAPRTRVLRMEVTAYCPCTKCCGPRAQGITASGKTVSYNDGKFVAADTSVLPFGKKIVVPGYAGNAAVEVIDRGGAIKGNKLDLYFPSHEDALIWGRQMLDVTVYE